MTIESVTHIYDLNQSYPAAGDAKSEGDDHIRNIKKAIINDVVGLYPNQVAGTTQTAAAGNHYFMQNSALSTLTLPPAPALGNWVAVTFENSRTDNVIARNGKNIMGDASDLTVNIAYQTVILRYDDATPGWRLI